MSVSFDLDAQPRVDAGKGASRRLRNAGQVPGIVYGGHKDPEMISLAHNILLQHLEHEAFYSHILDLKLNGEEQKVVLKDLQRHPSKPFVTHIDFQRISAEEKIRMHVPLHFVNENVCVGLKKGGTATHNINEVEITCLPKDLPEFIAVDMSFLDTGETIHVAELQMPEGVELTHSLDPDAPVVSIHGIRGTEEEGAEGGEETAE
jgi:large subunit ribosomal protein L25